MVEKDELIGCSVGSEERRNEWTKTPVLQDGLQDTATFVCIALNKHLDTKQGSVMRKYQYSHTIGPSHAPFNP